MTGALRVLIVDDNADDAELLLLELRQGGHEVCARRVETAGAMREALREAEWDLVLSDYTMPAFSGPAALQVLRESGLDLPFLVVSGNLGEEAAVEAMRTGVNDYISKGNLARLLPAIDRELREAANRRARRQAEQAARHLAAIVESSEDAIISVDLQGTVLTWNPGAERVYGYPAGEMVGRPIFRIVPPEFVDEVSGLMARVSRGEQAAIVEGVRVRKDGTRIHTSVTLSGVRDAAGRVVAISGIARDVTPKKAAEAALRRSEAEYRLLAESIPQLVWMVRPDGTFEYFNRRWTEYTGLTQEETIAGKGREAVHPDDLPRTWEVWNRCVAGGEPYEVEYRLRRADGAYRWFVARALPLRDDNGRILRWFGTCTDVEDQKRNEEAVARDALLLANVRDAVMVTDLDGVVTYWNEGSTRIFGWTAQEMLGRPLTDRVPPEARAEMAEAIRAIREGQDFAGEWHDYRKDGTRVWIDARVSLLRGPDGRPAGIMGISHDVTARKQAEAERDRVLARLQLQIERMPLAYVLHGVDLRISDWNPAAEKIFGYRKEEVLGMGPPFPKTVPHAAWPQVEEVFHRLRHGDMTAHTINENCTRDGRTITCEWYNTPLLDTEGRFQGVLSLALDITEKRSLEEQLRQAQKMEAIGQLAGGVAHDFNNLLTVINGYGDLVLSRLPEDDPARQLVGEITKAGERAAGLTRQLLAFSRKAILAPRVLDLNAVILEIEKMLRRVIGEDVRLATRLQPDLGLVRADPGQLEQVIFNLCVNARDSMPQGGKLTIETRNIVPDEGRQVLLTVSDTGCGIPPEVLPRIFEPFFTTKEQGKGTGLGLATVHGIVHQSGGRIEVSSEPGRGTTFRIYLPRAEGSGAAGKSLHGLRVLPRGSETILMVEDDDAVRALGRHLLAGCGYTVLEAADSDEAHRVCAEHAGPIALLATDVVMPGLGGRALAQRLLKIHPEMKVLYLSGYTDDAVVRHGILEDQVHFLQKPFSPQALALKVREVIDGPER